MTPRAEQELENGAEYRKKISLLAAYNSSGLSKAIAVRGIGLFYLAAQPCVFFKKKKYK